jgi:hypothetical protein
LRVTLHGAVKDAVDAVGIPRFSVNDLASEDIARRQAAKVVRATQEGYADRSGR